MSNERGGIISKLFVIPAGVALMVGFFFLGYYVGKYQGKSGAQGEIGPPLPELASKELPKQEEFTFYKTLTDKESKTVSIDLKPKPANNDRKADKKQATAEQSKDKGEQATTKEKKGDAREENENAVSPPKQTASKQPQVQAKKEVTRGQGSKLRYTIQISSYQEKELAEEDARKMKARGYAAIIVSSSVPDKGTWYRVRLGSFSNRAAAEKLANEIRSKEGISSFITIE